MNMPTVFQKDISELSGRNFYYSRRFAKGDFNVIKPHSHEHYELYYLTEGSRRYFIKNKIYTVNTGDVILIKPNVIHYTAAAADDKHERILLNFTEDYIPPQIKQRTNRLFDMTCISLPESKRSAAEEIFAKIAAEYDHSDKYSDFMESELLAELLVTFFRTGTEHSSDFSASSQNESTIDRLLEYLNVNLSQKITLDEAAAVAGFSKSHFSKIFKELTGFTFNNYLNLHRLLTARRLLEKTRDSVTDIAYECGFADSGYFSTVFRNHFDMSPLEYRKKCFDGKK